MAQLAIGTAQFGLDYGIANQHGRIDRKQAATILGHAMARGCRWLDTAAAYGEAEETLGRIDEARSFRVCTKIGAKDQGTPDNLAHELMGSLQRLGRSSVDILLLHRSTWLQGEHAHAVLDWSEREKDAGRIDAFGISVYTPDEIPKEFENRIDWVQVPLSILAQDWLRGGYLDRLRDAGIRIQARSLLAQGLVAVDPAQLPEALSALKAPLEAIRESASNHHLTPLQLALAFAAQAPTDLLVIGVETVDQLDACLLALQAKVDLPWADFACTHNDMVDPRFWPAGLRIA